MRFSRLYRGPGWARYRVRRLESLGNAVRVYEAHLTWVDVTHSYSDPAAVARAEERVAWAATNCFRRILLEEPKMAEYLMRHSALDRAVDTAADVWARLVRRTKQAGYDLKRT
jgi:hypothetical protein